MLQNWTEPDYSSVLSEGAVSCMRYLGFYVKVDYINLSRSRISSKDIYKIILKGASAIEKRREANPKFIIMWCVILAIMIILQCVQVIFTPHTFVRVLNLVSVIVLSIVVGSFIREIFVLKKKEEEQPNSN